MSVCKYMSIKNNILVIFSSIFLMLSNSAISQDIFLHINQNRTYNTDAQKNVMFFVGQNEKPKEKVPSKNRIDIERSCMWTSSQLAKEVGKYQPYEECMEANGLVP